MIHTIETRLKLNTTQEAILDSCVVLWSTYYRKTWKLWNNQQLTETAIYHQLMGLKLFTSAQVKSLINKVKNEHDKIKELSKTQLKQKYMKEKVKSKVDETLLLQKELFNHDYMNEYNPFAVNLTKNDLS